MTYTKLVLSTITLFTLLAGFSHADFNITDWEFERNIQVSRSGFAELTFDDNVFENSAPGLKDIRVISGSGVETPYKLAVERSSVERSRVSGSILDNSIASGGDNSFIVDLGNAGIFHNQVDVESNSLNFRREVEVEASNDRSDWSLIQRSAVIYDYTDVEAALKVRNTTIKYGESTKRYLKITVLNKGETPLNISGASAYYEKNIQAKVTSYNASIIEKSNDSEKRATMLIVDLGSTGLPNNNIVLSISNENFQRDVAIEGSNDRDKWYIIQTRDVIFSFRTPKFTGSKTEIKYSENNYRYLRITIFNQDNAPLDVWDVSVSGILRKLVFEAVSGETYKLYYGNPDARYPQYDLERFFQYLETENLPEAQLGAYVRNPSYVAKVPPKPPISERSPWLLPVILSVSALILGGFLFKLFMSVKKKLPPPS